MLLVAEELLVQLLALTQAGEHDLDPLGAGELDHPLRDVEDPHRFAHLEDHHLAGVADRTGLHHELARLRDGHEVAGDVGMGDRDGAAGGDLGVERVQHRAA